MFVYSILVIDFSSWVTAIHAFACESFDLLLTSLNCVLVNTIKYKVTQSDLCSLIAQITQAHELIVLGLVR